MNVVWLYRQLVDVPPVQLTAKLNHALYLHRYLSLQDSLAVPRQKDKVIAEVIPSMSRRLQAFHAFSLLAWSDFVKELYCPGLKGRWIVA